MPPRRAAAPFASVAAVKPPQAAPAPAPHVPELSPILKTLRTDWRWACMSQFINMYSDAFGLLDFDIDALEIDLDSTENGVLLDVIAKLLYALTWNRNINRDNAFEHLRKQYIKRLPHRNPFGTLEDPVEWYGLDLDKKIQALHQLCDWQLAEPARFRQLLKSEEGAETWRIEPVGYDKVGNTYWMFDDNRLWVQHPPPRPPRPVKKAAPPKVKKETKKKPAPTPKAKYAPKKREAAPVETSRGRKRTKVAAYGNFVPAEMADPDAEPEVAATPTRGTRASARSSIGNKQAAKPPTRATRNSRRSDGWESVPDEWLDPKKSGDDSDSELSELTDLDSGDEAAPSKASSVLSEAAGEEDQDHDEGAVDAANVGDTTEKQVRTSEGLGEERMNDEADVEMANGEVQERIKAAGEAAQTEAEVAAPSEPPRSLKEPSEHPEAPVSAAEPYVTKQDLAPALDGATNEAAMEGVVPKVAPGPDADVKPTADDSTGEVKLESQDAKVESNANEELPETKPALVWIEDEVDENDEVQVAARDARNPGFLEWECICVTLYEWKHIADRFEGSTNKDEKAFHRWLVNSGVPAVVEVLQRKENERIKEEAVVNRKRSSRIAVKELAKEEAMKREEAAREAEERMDRARRAERRQAIQEAEVVQKSREDRHREREERIREREEAAIANAVADSKGLPRTHVVVGDTDSEYDSPAPRAAFQSTATSGASTPKLRQAGSRNGSERWQLACEICGLTGWNMDNETEIVSCDVCARWQHVRCHDRADAAAGKPPRNWDRVDFKCRECTHRLQRQEEAERQAQRARVQQLEQRQQPQQRGGMAPQPSHMARPAQYSWSDGRPTQAPVPNHQPVNGSRVEPPPALYRPYQPVANGSAQSPYAHSPIPPAGSSYASQSSYAHSPSRVPSQPWRPPTQQYGDQPYPPQSPGYSGHAHHGQQPPYPRPGQQYGQPPNGQPMYPRQTVPSSHPQQSPVHQQSPLHQHSLVQQSSPQHQLPPMQYHPSPLHPQQQLPPMQPRPSTSYQPVPLQQPRPPPVAQSPSVVPQGQPRP